MAALGEGLAVSQASLLLLGDVDAQGPLKLPDGLLGLAEVEAQTLRSSPDVICDLGDDLPGHPTQGLVCLGPRKRGRERRSEAC